MHNVIHIHNASALPAAVGAAIAAAVNQQMWCTIPTTQTVESIDITQLDSLATTYHYTTDGTGKWKGTATGDPIIGSCAVISFRTAFRGRSNRGRAYLGPVAEGAQSGGFLGGGYASTASSGWGSFGSSLITNSFEHVVASYKHLTAITVTNYTMRGALGTQRRRQDALV
jgi:hypothetical protein